MEVFNKDFIGVFWVNEERKIHGSLNINEQGKCKLSTLNSFEKLVSPFDYKNHDVIYGIISNSDSKYYQIILYDCCQTQLNSGLLNYYTFISNKGLISKSDSKIPNNNFYSQIKLNSKIFNNWVNISGLSSDLDELEKNSIKHLYAQPKEIKLFKNQSIAVAIQFQVQFSVFGKRKSFIEENVQLVISPNEPVIIENLLELKFNFDRLLSVLLFKPHSSDNVYFIDENGSLFYELIRPEIMYSKVSRPLDFNKFIENSQSAIFQWLNNYEDLKILTDSFFSVYGRKGVLLENAFMTYVSILESFYDKAKYTPEIIKICEGHDKALNKDRKGKKVIQLVNRLIYAIDSSVLKEKFIAIVAFAEKIKKTRNYHTHLEIKHKSDSFNTQELIQVNILLEFIIRENFMEVIDLKNLISPNDLKGKFDKLEEFIIK